MTSDTTLAMLPMIQVGPAALPVRPLLMLVGFFLCLSWTEKRLPAVGLNKDLAFNAGYLFGGVTVVAGRLWYVATHLAAYQLDPLGIVSPSIVTVSFAEGAVAGLLAIIAYLAFKGVSFAACADAVTPGVLALASLASLGAFASGDAYGAPSSVPWTVTLWDAQRHPSQVYELLVGVVALAIAMHARSMPRGAIFLVAAACYSAGRVFIEAYRGDSLIIGDGFRAMQIAWLGAVLAALVMLRRRAAERVRAT